MILLNKFLRVAIKSYEPQCMLSYTHTYVYDTQRVDYDWLHAYIYQYKSIEVRQYHARGSVSFSILKKIRNLWMSYAQYIDKHSIPVNNDILYHSDACVTFHINRSIYTNDESIKDALAKYTQIWKFVNAAQRYKIY